MRTAGTKGNIDDVYLSSPRRIIRRGISEEAMAG
jgi:hypothetical protein